MPGPHVGDKKGKKAMVYKARKDRRREEGKKKKKGKRTREEKKKRITSLGHVRRGLLLGSMIVS